MTNQDSEISVYDVAKYILEQLGETTAMKLQKLTYYTKAWSLVWDEDELFPEQFQAWANGAVCTALYEKHRGMFKVTPAILPEASSDKLSENQKDTIDKVLSFYSRYTAQQLSDINHQEDPWLKARGKTLPGERSTAVISSADIAEYHSGIWNGDDEQER